MSNAPAGWYTQPDGTQRWWTGSSWSEVSAPGTDTVVHGQVVQAYAGPPAGPMTHPVQPGQPAPLVAGPYGYAPAVRVAPKSPGVAVIASFFLPGLGQFINGQAGKGVAFLLTYLVSFVLLFVFIGFITLPAVWIWSMVDAYSSAQAWNARHGILS
ncbi:hypothetical protein [Phycicoccus sp.]|uniref:hypothetical protein n=1 Tax=Phycicoccus sp. TaxID=1902410 RepID=UPI002C04FAD8|nr:hypothetical protein [Phycicoccus sp.]HMM96296.1 DUF2510 domain-containing protein [Phycicoccus sp.]